jgi:hypothetical protein
MIKGKDIVIIGIQAWDVEIGSNCKKLQRNSLNIIGDLCKQSVESL